MYKNQLQELAQRSCFNLPSYSCVREGPDHAPRFKATVNFNGETFESPSFCSTLRQAEHAAAEVALTTLANQGPSKALASKILDETGVYKNLLQETAHRAGLNLPIYTTIRSGPGHVPVFSCTVELAGLTFTGEPAKTKKQAQKNAAMAAWSTLKQVAQRGLSPTTSTTYPSESDMIGSEEREQVVIARVLSSLQQPKRTTTSSTPQKQQAHISMDPNHPSTSTLSPFQYTDWAYWNFSTEMSIYRTWQQAQLSHHQSCSLLALQVAPPLPLPPPLLPAAPHVLPFMPSIFHPDQLYFCQERAVGPTNINYMSSNSVQVPGMCQSKVTIQEIQEEKPEKPSQEEEAKTGDTAQVEPSPGAVRYGRAPSNQIEFKLQNLHIGEPSQCNNNSNYLRPHQENYGRISKPPYSAAAAPVRIRTVGPMPFAGPRPQILASSVRTPPEMRTRGAPFLTRPRVGFGVQSRSMAPAVHIRSVVPVCSAPPPRKVTGSGQEVKSSGQEKIGGEQD